MSEYQYYDFRAIDRPLTRNEMAALRAISTRAAISTTSFTNHYEWGDLKANPSKLLEKYFDVFVYVANWGTHEFHIRLPQKSVDYRLFSAMARGELVRVRNAARSVIVEFGSESEWDGEDDGTGWMASLMSLRSDLLRGDLRCLYLGWLRYAQDEEFGQDDLEPPVPAGLGELSAPLHALIEFLEIDEDLVEVAAQASKSRAAEPSPKELSKWVRRLPEKDKNELLIAAAVEPGERWRNDFVRRFQRESLQQSLHTAATARRSVGDILAAAHTRAKERIQRLNERRAAEETRRKAEDEANRTRYLDQLGRREPEIWKQVAVHILKRQPNDYAKAVGLLTDLHELAVRRGKMAIFQTELESIRQTHAAKESFLRRLAKANLSVGGSQSTRKQSLRPPIVTPV
ncbi:MAG TPA: hypothetical protein VFE61_19060 [Candidatus Sulfotelmatobacter sp.]|nr:hypothetical protein [Candidatus Sulfotelmatobacter sp.]